MLSTEVPKPQAMGWLALASVLQGAWTPTTSTSTWGSRSAYILSVLTLYLRIFAKIFPPPIKISLHLLLDFFHQWRSTIINLSRYTICITYISFLTRLGVLWEQGVSIALALRLVTWCSRTLLTLPILLLGSILGTTKKYVELILY